MVLVAVEEVQRGIGYDDRMRYQDLYLDVGRCAFRLEGGAVAPPARARVIKAVGKRFEGSLVGGDAERH